MSDAEIHIVPMADGGEGTAEIIAPEMGYARYEAVIHAL
ncbi:glycerate kinase [Muribaculum intestinale]